ncbi:UDP-N-acetylmuramoyl-tripeptide--D-alanyl-D-alanine ligase [Flagellimonas sp. 2504JD1-5]
MTLEELHGIFLAHPTACTDTRKITKDCIFFALKGPNFNGNEFAQQALEKGAAYAIIDEASHKISDNCLLVDDVLETLQKLATFHRNYSNARVISLTGSNGKTTTKELINAVLSKKYKTVATIGNLNNHIGVPLTLLSIEPDTELAIVEMGANHKGEIEFLCDIAQPDFGYITNFGKAHLEGFGGIEGVIEGKSELYKYLASNNKSIFLNADDPVQLEKLASYIKKIGFSSYNHEFFNITLVETNPFVVINVESAKITTQLIGGYNFPNCCAAITIGKYFNVPMEDIKIALELYVPVNNRSQIIKKNGFSIILDAYNANPSSMKAALDNFKNLQEDVKTLILGDMFEMGPEAATEHQFIVDLARDHGFSKVFLVGENFFQTQTDFEKFKNFTDFQEYLNTNPLNGGSLLIKGSRGMALERVLELL